MQLFAYDSNSIRHVLRFGGTTLGGWNEEGSIYASAAGHEYHYADDATITATGFTAGADSGVEGLTLGVGALSVSGSLVDASDETLNLDGTTCVGLKGSDQFLTVSLTLTNTGSGDINNFQFWAVYVSTVPGAAWCVCTVLLEDAFYRSPAHNQVVYFLDGLVAASVSLHRKAATFQYSKHTMHSGRVNAWHCLVIPR